MTLKRAAGLLKCIDVDDDGQVDIKTWYSGISYDLRQSLNMAIWSLEAWGKVKEEIQNIPKSEGSNAYERGVKDSCDAVIKIIDNTLKNTEIE